MLSKRKIVIITSILFIIVFFFIKSFFKKNPSPSYQKVKVERGTIISNVSASGTVQQTNMVNITTQASGVIKKVFVKEGEVVSVGQKIAEIELDREGQQKNASAWSNYLSAKTNLDSAKATEYSLQSDMLSKWKTFYELSTSSTYQNSDGTPNEINRALPEFHIAEKDWLAAEAKYKNQAVVVNQAQASLENAWITYQLSSPIITAPSAGVIKSITIVPGMVLVSQTSPYRIAIIQKETKPLISINLTEIDVSKVKIGQKATITFDSLPNKTFTGKVVTIDRVGTTSNNVVSYPALIQLDTASLEIIPNMAANVSIIIETKNNVLLIPSTAIQTQAGQSVVRILKNGQEQQIPVEIGLQNENQTEIISGLSEGDEVIIGTPTNQTQQRGTSGFGGATRLPVGGGGFRIRF